MSEGGDQGLKRKRSESVERAVPLETSLLPAAELASEERVGGLPLTRRNLGLHTRTLPSGEVGQSESNMSTKTKASENSMPHNIHEVETLLRHHGLLYEAKTNNPRLPELKKMARERFLCQRHSPMKADEIEHVRHEIYVHRNDNENSFLHYFWNALIKSARTKLIEGVKHSVYFDDDGVAGIWDHDFHPNALFDITPLDQKAKKILTDFPRLKTPKPDIAFGFTPDSFTKEEELIIDKFADFIRICKLRAGVFFIVEAKVASSSIYFAVHQANRGGAALVRAYKRLNDYAGFTGDKNPADKDRNIVVSLAVDERSAMLCIHWVETTPDDGELYHSHLVKEYLFSRDNDIMDLRRDVDNVLDWGALVRKPQLKELLVRLKNMDRLPSLAEEAKAEKEEAKSSKGKSAPSSSGAKKRKTGMGTSVEGADEE